MITKDLLRTTPSFLSGMARALDLGGTLDEYEIDAADLGEGLTDAEALGSDRAMLRDDFLRAYRTVEAQFRSREGTGGEEA